MSDRYKSTKRCYLIDHHSPQPPIVPLGKMEADEYERFFETAQIDSLMVYCKDHWGVTYYDSDVPGAEKHQGVKGDWIRTVRDLTARRGIEFVAYYCIEYDEGAARRFPQWRVRQADGTPLIRDDEFAKWSLVCYQTGYREYALSQLEEIVSRYHPDSLFLDIFGASLCYCESCRAKYLHRFGRPLPETEDGIAAQKQDIIRFLDENASEFLTELKGRLKAVDPSLAITINFSCHYPDYIRSELDYQYSEPLLRDNWYSSAYARDTAIGQSPMLAPGEASTVYNYDSPSQYICDLSSIAANGCRVGMYSGSQHIDGTLEHEEARRLGAVYAELKKMELYFTDTRCAVKGIGILQSDLSKTVGSDRLLPDAILRMKRKSPHTQAVLGAMMACEHAKIPYRILPENSITEETLKTYAAVLLPEVYIITPSLLSKLQSYVKAGGKLIISGRSGSMDENGRILPDNALSSLNGTVFVKEHDEYAVNRWSAYIKAASPELFSGLAGVSTPPVSEFFIENRTRSAQCLASFLLPAVKCTPSEWINWWCPPPGEETSLPAITLNRYGSGQVIQLAFDYFTMASTEEYRDTNALFDDLLSLLQVKTVLKNETGIPGILRTAFFEDGGSYQIHQISTVPNRYRGEVFPVSGGIITSQRPVTSARLVYPEEKELQVTKENGVWRIQMPEFEIQQLAILNT